ncbi:MAG: hypothetical protein WDN06_11420 [Asticcacaulis sp.]
MTPTVLPPGVDQTNPLSQDGGKAVALSGLGLAGDIAMVGDGWTDFEVYQSGRRRAFLRLSPKTSPGPGSSPPPKTPTPPFSPPRSTRCCTMKASRADIPSRARN